ncbi:MAG: DUF2789 domain-containing protein [Spongiibacteraceae bacterium]
MESPVHSIAALFDQLGLESTDEAIAAFIQKNGPLPAGVELSHAAIWSPSQSVFLKKMIDDDADWAEVVDQLNARLR